MFAPRREIATLFPMEERIMRKFTLLFVLCACLIGWCVTGNALAQTPTTVVVGFEEFAEEINDDGEDHDSEYGWSWNGTTDRYYSGLFPTGFLTPTGDIIDCGWDIYVDECEYQTDDGTTFYVGSFDGVVFDDEIMSFWTGVGLSTVTNTTYAGYLNEMVSTTGSGNNNSETYGVFHSLTGIPSTPAITLPEGATLTSIAIANTVYAVDSMTNGDEYSNGLVNDGDYFSLYIEGQDANGYTTGVIEVELGKVVNGILILNNNQDWQTVYFDPTFAGTETLWFYLDGNDYNIYGLGTPCYFAFDDLTYELDDDDDEIESP
jgi:hypothetical protein